MDYRPLGRTGLSVSALSLGTMTWGEQNTAAEAFEQMFGKFTPGAGYILAVFAVTLEHMAAPDLRTEDDDDYDDGDEGQCHGYNFRVYSDRDIKRVYCA